MKRIISIISAAALCLSLTACSNQAPNPDEIAKYKKYETLINYLEAGNYEEAILEIIALSGKGDPTSEQDNPDGDKKRVAIDITMDNWQDYFDVVRKEEINRNAFDEIEDVRLNYYIILKSEYTMAPYAGEDAGYTNIAAEAKYHMEWRHLDIDYENGKITVGDPPENPEDFFDDGERSEVFSIEYEETDICHSFGRHDDFYQVPADLEIVRIQGKLYILE